MTSLRSRLFGDFYSFFLTSLLRQQWPRTALRPSSSWCRQERNNPLEIPAKLPCFRPQKPHRMYLAVKNDAIACFYAVGKTPAPDSLVKPCQVLWWQLPVGSEHSDPSPRAGSQCTIKIPGRTMSCHPASAGQGLLQMDKSHVAGALE